VTGGDWAGRRLHFVGLGGAGMSGLALVAVALGASVTGSDRAESPYLERVRAAGVRPRIGHDPGNVPEGDDVELVVSTAIPATNPERAAGRERGLRELHRGALLGELSRLRRTIAIAGTHGKTTTASMAAHALLTLGWDPSYVIGGELTTTATNAAAGAGEWLVVEADESDRSFLELEAEIAVVTNIELDHHTTYGSLDDLETAFAQFLRNGLRRVVADTPDAEAFLDRGEIVEAAFYGASEIELHERGSRFRWAEQEVALAVPGAHNVANAAAALTACVIAGARPAALAGTLADFRGAGRRFERLGVSAVGALVVDDYAHHPTELAATIAAARTLGPRRVVAAFQPHLYSRTQLLAREFGAALALADVACVLDVYPARERADDFPGVSGLLVAEAAADAARGRVVAWTPSFDDAERVLGTLLREGDLCLVLGAGDIDTLGRRLVAFPSA
jgi:UDP-N-acetylmuramate--alanine ligase